MFFSLLLSHELKPQMNTVDFLFNTNSLLASVVSVLFQSSLDFSQVPAVIRKEENPMLKLELAIIENLQREDLNPIDRARAFHATCNRIWFLGIIQKSVKVGKSREYVSNSLRTFPNATKEIIDALSSKK